MLDENKNVTTAIASPAIDSMKKALLDAKTSLGGLSTPIDVGNILGQPSAQTNQSMGLEKRVDFFYPDMVEVNGKMVTGGVITRTSTHTHTEEGAHPNGNSVKAAKGHAEAKAQNNATGRK